VRWVTRMDPRSFERIITANESRLCDQVLRYASERGPARCEASGQEALRSLVAELSQALVQVFSSPYWATTPDADVGHSADPAESFGMAAAQRRRVNGESSGISLEIIKFCRLSCLDLVREQGFPTIEEEETQTLLERFFGRVETVFCAECASLTARASAELVAANALLEREIARHGKTAEALERSERLFHTAIDALAAHIAILDCDGTIMAVNRAWREFADANGFMGDDYGIGSSYLAVCDSATGDDAEIARTAARGIRDLLDGSCREFHLEYPCHSPDEQRWFQVRATCLKGFDPACVVVAHDSITEVKRAEEKILSFTRELEDRVRQRTLQLELTNRELEGFCYAVSHDLRAHLARLEGLGRGLFEDYGSNLDSQARHYVERICLISIELRRIIDALLDLSRVTRCELSFREVNLSDVARSVAEELRMVQPRRRVSVTIVPNVLVRGDTGLLTMVMKHLFGNAWKFTGRQQAAEIEFGMTPRHGLNVYYIRDNGVGFDMRYAGRLFQPFQRLHSPGEFEGVGVGLATVQRIIQRHGGRIWAEGEMGRGATFYFALHS